MIPLLFVEMFNGVTQHRTRHSGSVLIQEAQQPLAILLAGFAYPSSCGLVDQVMVVVNKISAISNVSATSP